LLGAKSCRKVAVATRQAKTTHARWLYEWKCV